MHPARLTDEELCRLRGSKDVHLFDQQVARRQFKKLVKWLSGDCGNKGHMESRFRADGQPYARKGDCYLCWQELLKEVGAES